jgi:hypothetical protein
LFLIKVFAFVGIHAPSFQVQSNGDIARSGLGEEEFQHILCLL